MVLTRPLGHLGHRCTRRFRHLWQGPGPTASGQVPWHIIERDGGGSKMGDPQNNDFSILKYLNWSNDLDDLGYPHFTKPVSVEVACVAFVTRNRFSHFLVKQLRCIRGHHWARLPGLSGDGGGDFQGNHHEAFLGGLCCIR